MTSSIQPVVSSVISQSFNLLNSPLFKRDDDADSQDATPACEVSNDYNGRMGARISSIFVILVAGTFGALFPVISSKSKHLHIHPMFFFVAKYFGSGVVIATGLIHLLQPANEALSDPCLGEGWQVYPYAYGIALASLFGTFLVELLSRRYLSKRGITHTHGDSGFGDSSHDHTETNGVHVHNHSDLRNTQNIAASGSLSPTTGELSDKADDYDLTYKNADSDTESMESRQLAMQLGSIFILEFGIIFHSVFIGLSLAVSGDEFASLYVVLVFHQMFEGLGLGTRIALAPWPGKKKYVPWILGAAFGITTPISIAIGLGVRASYPPGSHKALVTNGIFDAISAGILLYVGLVELIGNEFFGDENFKKASTAKILLAFFVMCWGAGLMALLGRWA